MQPDHCEISCPGVEIAGGGDVGRGAGSPLHADVTTSSAPDGPSLDSKTTASALSGFASTKLNVPFPLTNDVTLYSSTTFVPVAPLSSIAPPVRAGRLVQVMAPSVQPLVVPKIFGPFV